MTNKVILVLNNIRSAHNVGAILRTADGLGVEKVFLCGYTPYPISNHDTRLPHLAHKIDSKIAKTALGAEKSQDWAYVKDIKLTIDSLKNDGYQLVALEQSSQSTDLTNIKPSSKLALIVGNEIDGVDSDVLKDCDITAEIPMRGKKESFNVSVATGIALFYIIEMV